MYVTGTAHSAQGLLSAISSFMQSAGWTLHDTVSSNDLVFKSLGSDGKQSHYVRITNPDRWLDFVTSPVDFTVGETVTGATSGASGVIRAQTDAGTTGTLVLNEVVGHFLDGETITDPAGGTGVVNGRLRFANPASPSDIDNCLDHLRVTAYTYWDAGTHTGVNPQGVWGPLNIGIPNPNDSSLSGYYGQKTTTVVDEAFKFLPTPQFVYPATLTGFDGVRRFVNAQSYNAPYGYNSSHGVDGFSSEQVQRTTILGTPLMDLSDLTNPYTVDQAGIEPAFGGSGVNIVVFDRERDTHYRYFFSAAPGGLPAGRWRRWSFANGTVEPLATIPINFDNTVAPQLRMAWDGADYIYVVGRANPPTTHAFVRYQISTDTWTFLADLPEESTDGVAPFGASGVYVPRGVIPGVEEDVILFLFTNLGNASPGQLQRYNVGSDTWTSIPLPPPGWYQERSCMWWDGDRYLWFYGGVDGVKTVDRLDLQNIGDGWTSLDFWGNSAVGFGGVGYTHVAPRVCRVRTKVGDSVGYHLVGDLDSVKIVTRIGDNYYWCYFGGVNSYYPTQVSLTTALASAGSPTTINVDATTGFSVGQRILLLGPAGDVTSSIILALPTPTSMRINSPNNIAPGTRVFVDAVSTVLAGDGWLATASFDALGYQAEGLSSMYVLKPLASKAFSERGPGPRGTLPLTEMVVTGVSPALATWENKGTLKNVYVIDSGPYPKPQSEEVIQDAQGNQYVVFRPTNSRYTADARAIALGPL